MNGILLLDASYRPLRVIPVRRAVGLMIAGRAEGVADEFVSMRSASSSVEVPVVLRLAYSVTIPFRRDEVTCTRRGILARDGHVCQFVTKSGPCDATATTIDHVVPKAKGGEKMSWSNLVAACAKHNHQKADRNLSDMGWKLKTPPYAPKAQMRLLGARGEVPAAWEPFLASLA